MKSGRRMAQASSAISAVIVCLLSQMKHLCPVTLRECPPTGTALITLIFAREYFEGQFGVSQPGIAESVTAEPVLDELLQRDTNATQAYKILQAMVELGRNLVLLEATLDSHGAQRSLKPNQNCRAVGSGSV